MAFPSCYLEYRKNGDIELYVEDIEVLSTDEYLDLLNEQKSEIDLTRTKSRCIYQIYSFLELLSLMCSSNDSF